MGRLLAVLGVLIGTVGADVTSGVVRFTGGALALTEGVSFIAVILGLFAFVDICSTLGSPETRVQVKTEDVLRKTATVLTRLFDVTATKDWANCAAKADVVVDGRTLVAGAPVSYLLFLEKQLTDLHTFVKKLPVLDAAESWVHDVSIDAWKTEPVRTIKTKKIPRNHVKAEATEKHPAQVEVYYEDVPVGYWTTVKFSGALPAQRVNELLERVEKVQTAVKFAREEANATEVVDQTVGAAVFGYLFG